MDSRIGTYVSVCSYLFVALEFYQDVSWFSFKFIAKTHSNCLLHDLIQCGNNAWSTILFVQNTYMPTGFMTLQYDWLVVKLSNHYRFGDSLITHENDTYDARTMTF